MAVTQEVVKSRLEDYLNSTKACRYNVHKRLGVTQGNVLMLLEESGELNTITLVTIDSHLGLFTKENR